MRTILVILLNGTIFCVLWIAAIMVSNLIFDVTAPTTGDPGTGLLLMWLCCLLEVTVLHYYISYLRYKKFYRVLIIFITLFTLQFVFTQIESWYYLDQQTIPKAMIASTVLAGFLASFAYSQFASFRYPETPVAAPTPGLKTSLPAILFLGILVYPMIYFLAGYFIAWQWEAIREYYTGSAEINSFYEMMKSNVQQGIFTFQAVRGVLWTMLGFLILKSLRPISWKFQGVIIGLLFAVLMNAQLLIPNPYMPDEVRAIHALETSSSNFIWGFIIAFCWHLLLRKSSNPTPAV